jgi:hypothetical protein
MVEYDYVTVDNVLTLKNTSSYWVDLQCIQVGPGILQVNRGIKCLKDISAYGGALMTASAPNSTGGGAVAIGHAWERSDDPPRIALTDYELGDRYKTLYITAGSSQYDGADAVLANMKLRRITVTENVIVSGGNDYGPGLWFGDFGPVGYFGEALGVGLNHAAQVVLNSAAGVVTAIAGNLSVILDNGEGGIGCAYLWYFDALDDLALAKKYSTKTVAQKGVEKTVIDPDSMPFLKMDSNPQYFDLGKTHGFLLGCIKALVQRVESLESRLKDKS